MSSSKHENLAAELDKPYEENVVGVRGIIYFGVGLALLIIITFGLMWLLLGVFQDDAVATKGPDNPMAMSDKERLPAEPRLQAAPGFGVDGPNGRVNLELRAPQSEYLELQKEWKDVWANGMKDPKTGAVTSLPIEKAKEILLSENVKARSGPEADKLFADSKLRFSDASAGRAATDRRR